MGNLQVRFLEGGAPAMAPGHSTVMARIGSAGGATRLGEDNMVCFRLVPEPHSPCSGSEQLLRKSGSAAQLNLESVFLCEEFQRIQPKKLQMIGNFPIKNRAFSHIFPHLAGSQNDFPVVVQERSQPFKQSVDS